MYHSYAQAVAAVRPGLQVGYLDGVGLGALREPSQSDLLLAVLGAYSPLQDEQELETSYVVGGGAVLASWSAEHGAWACWLVSWHTHPESGLHAEFRGPDGQQLFYDEDEQAGAIEPELAAVLNNSRWRVLSQ